MCLHLPWQKSPSSVTEELPLVFFTVCQNAGASTGFCCVFLLLFGQNSSIDVSENPSGVEGATLKKTLGMIYIVNREKAASLTFRSSGLKLISTCYCIENHFGFSVSFLPS